MFNPQRLTLARQRRGLTKAALSEKSGVALRSVTAWENGETIPSDANVETLAQTLAFGVPFFHRADCALPRAIGASFRSLSKMTSGQRDAALAAGALAFELSDWIDARFSLPLPDVPDLRTLEPEAAAAALRAQWGLGEQRITNTVHLLESKGVRVFSLAERCLEVDAFSTWHNGAPFVFLNTMKSAEHSRVDALHELGHLVLHRHGTPQGKMEEQEANLFASAVLMPRASVLAHAPRIPTLDTLIRLKSRWDVSLMALIYRLRQLRILSGWQYRTLCIQASELGYRKREPRPAPRETSQLLTKVFALLRAEGISRGKIAAELGMRTKDLDELIFGLVMTSIDGGGRDDGENSPREALRLVKR